MEDIKVADREQKALNAFTVKWTTLSYTANTTKTCLLKALSRFNLTVARNATKEDCATLLIANKIPCPKTAEDRDLWAASVQPITSAKLNTQPVIKDQNVPPSSISSHQREAADLAAAKRLSAELNRSRSQDEYQNQGMFFEEDFDDIIADSSSSEVEPGAKRSKISHQTTSSSNNGNNSNNSSNNKLSVKQQMQLMYHQQSQQFERMMNTFHKEIKESRAAPISNLEAVILICSDPSCKELLPVNSQYCHVHGPLVPSNKAQASSNLPKPPQTSYMGANNSSNYILAKGSIVGSNNNNTSTGNALNITVTNIEPNFPFAQIGAKLPKKIIQAAAAGEWVPLGKFLPSPGAMRLQEAERGMSQTELTAHQMLTVLQEAQAAKEAVGGKMKSPELTITSAHDIVMAFLAGLIPAACPGKPDRYADYVLFALQISALLGQQQSWQYVLEYIEEIRRGRQTLEADWPGHKLAAYNLSGVHHEAWSLICSRLAAKAGLAKGDSLPNTSNNYNNNRNNNTNNSESQKRKQPQVCRQFQESGSCMRGTNCKYLHIPPNAASTSSTPAIGKRESEASEPK